MKKLHLKAVALVFMATVNQVSAAETFVIDPDHTTVAFSVNHLGFSSISGRFADVSGKIVLDNIKPQANEVDVSISTASINSTHAKRDDHLRSADFFNIKQYPNMKFKSTRFVALPDGNAKLIGDFTLLGTTKSIELAVTFNKQGANPFMPENYVAGFSATGSINRSDYGMNYGLPMIGDEVELQLEVEGIRQTSK